MTDRRPTSLLCGRGQVFHFRGNGYRIVDSFRGLSKPGTPDILTDYLAEYGMKVRYLHSDVDTLERIEIIRNLQIGRAHV